MKSPEWRLGAFRSCIRSGYSRRLPVGSSPPQNLLLALGALSIHRSGLEAALFQPALDLVFGEADIGFDPRVRDESLLHVCIDRLAVNLQQRLSCPPNSSFCEHGGRESLSVARFTPIRAVRGRKNGVTAVTRHKRSQIGDGFQDDSAVVSQIVRDATESNGHASRIPRGGRAQPESHGSVWWLFVPKCGHERPDIAPEVCEPLCNQKSLRRVCRRLSIER
jgi:hypothetical protein